MKAFGLVLLLAFSLVALVSAKAKDAAPDLISVIVPSYNRPDHLKRAVERIVLGQSYKNVEVILVDDSSNCLPEKDFSQYKNVRYFCLNNRRYTIGEKRNFAVEQSKGSFISFWDDDDVYAPSRLLDQYQALVSKNVDVSALFFSHIFDIFSSPPLMYRMKEPARGGPHFGTLMFRRSVFQGPVQFPNTSYAEDYTFVERALSTGARFTVVEVSWIYLKHDNTWREFSVNNIMDGLEKLVDKADWPTFLSSDDLHFFEAIAASHKNSLKAKAERQIINRFPDPSTRFVRRSNRRSSYGYGYDYGYGYGYGYDHSHGYGYGYDYGYGYGYGYDHSHGYGYGYDHSHGYGYGYDYGYGYGYGYDHFDYGYGYGYDHHDFGYGYGYGYDYGYGYGYGYHY